LRRVTKSHFSIYGSPSGKAHVIGPGCAKPKPKKGQTEYFVGDILDQVSLSLLRCQRYPPTEPSFSLCFTFFIFSHFRCPCATDSHGLVITKLTGKLSGYRFHVFISQSLICAPTRLLVLPNLPQIRPVHRSDKRIYFNTRHFIAALAQPNQTLTPAPPFLPFRGER